MRSTTRSQELRRRGCPDAVGLSVDLTDPAAIDDAFATIAERWGSVNSLINTLGPGDGALRGPRRRGWDATFQLGLMAAVRCTRAALPLLRAAEWARIVNFAAHSIQRQNPRLVAYTASKAAVASLSKNLAKSLAPDGILVNTISPGTIVTASFTEALDPFLRRRRPRLERPGRRDDLDREQLPPARRPRTRRGARTRSPASPSTWPRAATATSPAPTSTSTADRTSSDRRRARSGTRRGGSTWRSTSWSTPRASGRDRTTSATTRGAKASRSSSDRWTTEAALNEMGVERDDRPDRRLPGQPARGRAVVRPAPRDRRAGDRRAAVRARPAAHRVDRA